MILGSGAKVFDLSTEKDELRERYGKSRFGQSCLVARRLVEQGVPYITINYPGWDTHKNHFTLMRQQLPELDKGLATLLQDLADHGLLESTIIWWSGEFGRTPKIQWEAPYNGGRGHWGSALLGRAGGRRVQGRTRRGQLRRAGRGGQGSPRVAERPDRQHLRPLGDRCQHHVDPARRREGPFDLIGRRRHLDRRAFDRNHVSDGGTCHGPQSNLLPDAVRSPGRRIRALAQEESPHLGYAYPAGGQQGTKFQVLLGGQHLEGASVARISGPGVQAKVLEYLRPLNQGAFKTVQKQMQDLAEKKAAAAPPGGRRGRRGGTPSFTNANWTAEDEKRLAELRERMTTFYIRQTSAPSLVETVTLEVTLARDAAPGQRELRLQTEQGLTNPLVFEVGQLREYTETVGPQRRGRRKPGRESPPPAAGGHAETAGRHDSGEGRGRGPNDHRFAGNAQRPDSARQCGSVPVPRAQGTAARDRRGRAEPDSVPLRRRAGLVPGGGHAVRRRRPRGGLRR